MWSTETARKIVDYANKHDDQKAKDHFKLKDIDSVRRARTLLNTESRIINMPRILILDIETAPLLAYVWGKYNNDIHNADQFVHDWYMLTYSAKWYGEEKVYSGRLTGKESLKEDDKRLLKELSKYMNEADFVIAHNGDRFDFPRINSRLVLNKLSPISPYISIDTCKLARRNFGFTSNKLDDLLKSFNLDGKTNTGFNLWRRCVRDGEDKALKEMEEYNINDVIILEKLYDILRPYIKGLPNLMQSVTGMKEDMACPVCGGGSLKVNGFYRTNINIYQAYQCGDCGAFCRGKKNIVIDKNNVVPLAR